MKAGGLRRTPQVGATSANALEMQTGPPRDNKDPPQDHQDPLQDSKDLSRDARSPPQDEKGPPRDGICRWSPDDEIPRGMSGLQALPGARAR